MAEKIFVTDTQVRAAQILVDRDKALGREPDPATRKIAEALPGNSPRPRSRRRGASRAAAFRFWEALEPAEREALRAVASWRTFDAGTRLMTEGERADYVVVILGGRAKVSVDENGRERVLAVRGLGQLVGERGALQGSLRSATVTALDVVWALVVRTEDFAAFIRDHPRVLDILHDQFYDRLTEKPFGYGHGEEPEDNRSMGPGTATADRPYADLAAQRPERRLEVLNGENCTVLLSEVIRSSADARTESDRILIREALSSIMAEALPGIPDAWTLDRGDGILTVLPPNVSTAEVISTLLKELPAVIERHNRSQHASAQFQLRLAINVGPVFGDAAGVAGEAITVAWWLLETPRFTEAIVNSAASLGIIISPFIYETFIKPGPDLSEVASYTQIPVEIRGFSTAAWMKVIPPDPATQRNRA